jgi:hypothetical protein
VDNVLGPEYRTHEAVTDGHGDAVFAILKPGVILSSKHDTNLDLARDFPGWDVLKIWDSSIWAAMEVGKFYQNKNNWDKAMKYYEIYFNIAKKRIEDRLNEVNRGLF